MVDKMNSMIWSRPDGKAHYLTIPRDIVMDKTYPFKSGEKVTIVIDDKLNRLIIQKLEIVNDKEK